MWKQCNNDPEYAGEKAFKWEEEFKEIIENGGFDIIIGNPPYVRQELFKEDKPYYKEHYETYTGLADIYVYFFEKGIILLKNEGYFSYICSNKWIKAGYGKKLRKFLLKYRMIKYIDYTGEKIFQDATVDVSTIIISKNNPNNNSIFINNQFEMKQDFLNEENYIFKPNNIFNLKNKIMSIGKNIKSFDTIRINYGIKTGRNEIFTITSEEKNKLIDEDLKNEEIIKPVLNGKNIKQWNYNFENDYLLCTKNGINIKDKYPTIYKYLEKYEAELKKRYDQGDYWYNLRNCAYYDDFEKPKILWAGINDKLRCVLDTKNKYLLDTCYFLVSDEINIKYILAILNSNISNFILKLLCTPLGSKGYRIKTIYIEKLTIKIIDDEHIFDDIVDTLQYKSKQLNEENNGFKKWLKREFKIKKLSKNLDNYYKLSFEEFISELNKKKINTKQRETQELLEKEFIKSIKIIKQLNREVNSLENEMNNILYKIYDLNKEEIKIIEENI